jgi:hypothetical protein
MRPGLFSRKRHPEKSPGLIFRFELTKGAAVARRDVIFEVK